MPSELKWAISLLVGVGLIFVGWKVPFVLVTLHVLVCLLLAVVVLLQSGNAADLAGAFGGAGSQTAFGPRGAATFLSRATTWCAIMFMVTSITLGLRQEQATPAGSSILEKFSKPAPKSPPAPVTPSPQVPSAPQTPPAQTPSSQPPASGTPSPQPSSQPQGSQPQSSQPSPQTSQPPSQPPASPPPAKKP